MIEYENFKETVAEQFLSQMPDDFADYRVEIKPVTKVNRTEDRLQLIPPDRTDAQVIPSISVNQMYEDYRKSGNLTDTLAFSAFDYASAYREIPRNLLNQFMDNAKDRVIMMLINTEQNQELLKTVPHREFCDLSTVYRLVADMDEDEIRSAMIGNELAEHLGMDENALFMAAVRNTKRLFPPVIKSMDDVIRETFTAEGAPEELAETLVGMIPTDRMMYVISNNKGLYGAVSMLYENELHTLAQKLDSNLYLLPSSINEVIAMSAASGKPYELAQVVAEVNMFEVDLTDRLSNQVYHYDKDLRKITLATDTPNKRIDGYRFLTH